MRHDISRTVFQERLQLGSQFPTDAVQESGRIKANRIGQDRPDGKGERSGMFAQLPPQIVERHVGLFSDGRLVRKTLFDPEAVFRDGGDDGFAGRGDARSGRA